MLEPLDYDRRVEMINRSDRWEVSVKLDRWREGVDVRTWIFSALNILVVDVGCTCLSPETRSLDRWFGYLYIL